MAEMAHAHTCRLFAVVGAATAAAYFGLLSASAPLLQELSLPRFVQVCMQAVMVLTPIGVGAWWLFKKLRANYPARTARKGAMAFGLFTPVSWLRPSRFPRLLGQPWGTRLAILFLVW
jgi:hypothetical protein